MIRSETTQTEAKRFANKFGKFVVLNKDGEIADKNRLGYSTPWAFKTAKAANRSANRISGSVVAPD